MPMKNLKRLIISLMNTATLKEYVNKNTPVQLCNIIYRRKFILFSIIIGWLCISLILLYSKKYFFIKIGSYMKEDCQSLPEKKEYMINTPGCRIPKFHPFDPSTADSFQELRNPIGDCHGDRFLYYVGNKIYFDAKNVKKHFNTSDLNCTYRTIIRDPYDSDIFADYEIAFGEKKTLFFDEPVEDEFLKVTCFVGKKKVFTDYLAIPILKPKVEARCEKASKNFLGENPLNIIIMAIDSTSKLNFLRHFPLTNGLVETKLKPFVFHGHTKVADNTFVNIVPMMTGHFVDYYRNESDVSETYYDDLNLVWKEFSALGYRTLFMEDTPNAGTFTYAKKGFKKPATDYFLRPFFIATEKTRKQWRTKNGFYCFGYSMAETEFYYDYFYNFITLMDKRPFFAFSFISRPAHGDLNEAGFIDRPLFDMLQKLKSSNVLNNSLLILFSDHGLRFGPILQTYIGKIEERMPFMFQKYPDWFLKKNPDIQKALTINQHRLTTPFDIHKTLEDIVTLSSKNGQNLLKQADSGFGQSLFKEISPYRTCRNASITPHWCVCNDKVTLVTHDDIAMEIARGLMFIINNFTNSTINTSMCMIQKVKHIINSYASVPVNLKESHKNSPAIFDYFVTFEAEPSGAQFAGTVRCEGTSYTLMGEISRINSYGNQSICMNNPRLKKYCFCNNNTNNSF